MSVTTYTTVNGRILRQNKDGVVHNFVTDPLGSVVMVRDTSGNTVYTAEYDPYGNVQSETGTNPSGFGYVGTLGYVKDSASSLYVRARYLLTNLGRWLTKDPLWPSEPGFVYAGAAPSYHTDVLGLFVNPWIILFALYGLACVMAVVTALKLIEGVEMSDRNRHCITSCLVTAFAPPCAPGVMLSEIIPTICRLLGSECGPPGGWDDVFDNSIGVFCGVRQRFRVSPAFSPFAECRCCCLGLLPMLF